MIVVEFFYKDDPDDDWILGSMLGLPDGIDGDIFTINQDYVKVTASKMDQENYNKFKLEVSMIQNGSANDQKYKL
jgi:hypothetical protein